MKKKKSRVHTLQNPPCYALGERKEEKKTEEGGGASARAFFRPRKKRREGEEAPTHSGEGGETHPTIRCLRVSGLFRTRERGGGRKRKRCGRPGDLRGTLKKRKGYYLYAAEEGRGGNTISC